MTTTTIDSLNHQDRKRRKTHVGQKRHWSVLLFFTLATAIILFKTFDAIKGVLA